MNLIVLEFLSVSFAWLMSLGILYLSLSYEIVYPYDVECRLSIRNKSQTLVGVDSRVVFWLHQDT